jgi:hypothetical protein
MKKNNGKLAGILGTVIIHLIAAIIFMSYQIRTLQKSTTENFTVEFQPDEANENQPKEQLPTTSQPPATVEKILQGDNEMLNIARNLANKSDQKVDPAEIQDMVKEELIKSGQLGKDNFIDEQKKLPGENESDENISVGKEKPAEGQVKPKESQVMAANYKGPTRIYYDLKGRNHIYLPIPIYMCQGSGKVVLAIEVTQQGNVQSARVKPDESTTSDECLIETAVSTALASRFNPDVNSPRIENGTLTYHFVAQ